MRIRSRGEVRERGEQVTGDREGGVKAMLILVDKDAKGE